MDQKRIEIIAIGNDTVFSVGSIVISKEMDVYINTGTKTSPDFHTSRHASGKVHWRSRKEEFTSDIRQGQPISKFKGIELLGTHAFGVQSLPNLFPELFKDVKLEEHDGVFCVDMRQFEGKAFSIAVAMLTEEGLSSLLSSKTLRDRQVCIFPDCTPMIAITVGIARGQDAKT